MKISSGLINECYQLFHTKDLYQVLGATKEQKQNDLRKAFYKASLMHHPDRQEEKDKINATQRFQVLSKVYSLLADEDKRQIYDDTGVIDEGDELTDKSYDDWVKYWQLLFPKVTTAQIEEFHAKYRDSDEEIDDLIKIYNRSEGDMDVIMETMLFVSYSEENRVRDMIDKLIKEGRVKAYTNYTNEDHKKIQNRAKRALIEEKLFQKEQKRKKKDNSSVQDNFGDLAAAIQARHEHALKSSENLLDRLTEKYCKPQPTKKRLSKVSKKNTN